MITASGSPCELSPETRDTPIDGFCQEMNLAPGRIYRSRSDSIEMENGGANPGAGSRPISRPWELLSIDDFGTGYSSPQPPQKYSRRRGKAEPAVVDGFGIDHTVFRTSARSSPSQTRLALQRPTRAREPGPTCQSQQARVPAGTSVSALPARSSRHVPSS